MMGPTHAMSGVAAGLGAAALASHYGYSELGIAEVVVVAGITAGAALLPDIDHPSATLARTWGPVSTTISKAVNSGSAGIVNLTGSKKDKKCSNGHRTFTHTFIFAILAALLTYAAVNSWGTAAALTIFYILTSLAMQTLLRDRTRSMGPILSNIVAAGATWAAWIALPDTMSATLLGAVVFVGCVAHMIGDSVTVSGIPAFAPFLPVDGGKRWGSVHLLPAGMRVRAAGPADTVTFWLCAAASVVLLWVNIAPLFA